MPFSKINPNDYMTISIRGAAHLHEQVRGRERERAHERGGAQLVKSVAGAHVRTAACDALLQRSSRTGLPGQSSVV